MFGKISIIGCGLIGSSILRATEEKKLASKISVYDNSNRVMEYLKKNFSVDICSNLSETAKDADLIRNINSFPDKYETMIGERGITLSGGQKQRISIARAIIKEPKILILDDCLSAVDTNTENIILENLKKIMEDRTTIVISHRISSVKLAKKILVIEEGKIIEKGSHKELIKMKGHYYKLYIKQVEEEKMLRIN